jgi:hypothetical protein
MEGELLMNKENVVFNIAAMKNLVETDMYLSFVKRDLNKRNPSISEDNILEIIFNSNVVDSFEYEIQYIHQLEKVGKSE